MKDETNEKKWIICYKAREVCCVYQFQRIWFIVCGTVQPRNAPKNNPGFKIVAEAVNRIFKQIWDPLIEMEEDEDTDEDIEDSKENENGQEQIGGESGDDNDDDDDDDDDDEEDATEDDDDDDDDGDDK